MTEYVLENACLQLGVEPPFNCVYIPVRMEDGMPQIKIKSEWHDWPRDERREPPVKSAWGLPVAGISSSWRPA